MTRIKDFLKSRTKGFYIILGAAIFDLFAMIFYSVTGITEFSASYSAIVFVTGYIAFAIALVSLFFEYKLVREFSFLFILYAFIAYIGTQANMIANVFTSIDATSFSFGFIFNVIFFVVGLIASFVSIFFTKKVSYSSIEVVQMEAKENE